MTNEELQTLLTAQLQLAECLVTGDGYHFHARIVSDQFNGLSTVKRQQHVYSLIGELIRSGELHAITIQTYTQAEWEQNNG